MTARKSQEEAEKEIFTITNGEFSLVSEYVNGKGKSIFRHNSDSCLEPKQTKTYEGFKSNPRCMSCEKRKSINEMMLNLKGEIILLEETDIMTKKVKFKHVSENCKKPIFFMSPSRFKSRMRCPSCSFEKHCTPKPKKKEVEIDTKKEALEYNIRKYSKKYSINIESDTLKMECLECGHQVMKPAYKKIKMRKCLTCREREEIRLSKIELKAKGYEMKHKKEDEDLFILTHKSDECENFSFSLPKSSIIDPDIIVKCPVCFDEDTKHNRSTEWLKRVLKRVYGDEYDVLGEYVDSEKKIKFRHNDENCKEPIFYKTARGMKKYKCPSCHGSFKITQVDFENKVKKLTNGMIKGVTPYKGTDSDVLFECQKNECKGMFYQKPNIFYRKPDCPYCKGDYPKEKRFLAKKGIKVKKYEDVVRWTIENTKRYINQHSPTYDVIKKMENGKFLLRHNSDHCSNKVFEINTTEIKRKAKEGIECCPTCKTKKHYDSRNEEIKNKILKEKPNYSLLKGISENDKEKITVVHNEQNCGHEWYISLYSFFDEERECPKCSKGGFSKGEEKINDFLLKWKFDFKPWWRTDDCRYKNPLPFDFAIFNPDNSLNCLIEYDGQQHFYSIDYFGGEKTLKGIQKRDKIKNQYCKDNNIPLIRIPYLDFDNIETILEKELTALGLIEILDSKTC